MDSYEDYADRAKLMTKVHARPRGPTTVVAAAVATVVPKKGGAEDAGVGKSLTIVEVSENNGASNNKAIPLKKSKESKIASKQKENKKKALKRL